MSTNAWADLQEALTLLAKHKTNDVSPFHCEHDTLWVMSDPAAYTDAEIERLDQLGFFADDEDACFKSFRFGSA